MALLAIAYAVLASRLIGGRWGTFKRLGWWWGLPLMLGLVAMWLIPAVMSDPTGFREVALEQEITTRLHQTTPWGLVTSSWRVPFYAIMRFAPWSAFTILLLFHLAPRRWFTGALGPAILWAAVFGTALLVMLMTKRSDRLAPMFFGLAPPAAYWLVVVARRHRITAPKIAVACLALAVGFGVYNFVASPSAETERGARTHAFVNEVRSRVGDDPIAFVGSQHYLFAVLLGHARGAETATSEQLRNARWVITTVRDDTHARLAVIVSEPLIMRGGKTERLGLFRQAP